MSSNNNDFNDQNDAYVGASAGNTGYGYTGSTGYTSQDSQSQGGGIKGDFLLGLLVGATVGAAMALLYAPSAGHETRGQLRSTAEDVRGRAGGLTSTVTNRAQDLAAQVRERASSVASSVSSTVQDLTSQGAESSGQGTGEKGDLPPTGEGDVTGRRDLHELQVSDDPDVVADRVNNAMQGAGPEAHEIAEQLSQAPSGNRTDA